MDVDCILVIQRADALHYLLGCMAAQVLPFWWGHIDDVDQSDSGLQGFQLLSQHNIGFALVREQEDHLDFLVFHVGYLGYCLVTGSNA